MKKAGIFLLFVNCLILSGCYSTPEVKPRMARFDSSEVNSEAFNFKLSVGSDSSNQIPLAEIEKTDKGSSLRLSAAMTLGNGFEIKYSNSGEDKIGIKYQLFGAPLEQKAAGNVSLATSLSYIRSERDDYNPSSSLSVNPAFSQWWELEQQALDVALISGYRFNERLLMYGGLFYQDGDVEGEIRSALSTEVSPQRCTESDICQIEYFGGDGKGYGANLGLEYEFTSWFVVAAEVVYHHAKWFDRTNSETAANLNLEFRF
ncbi:outer membrane beta-barrel protein [Pseudoalteromonas sp. YIC-656]|uniref:outer membrane beta-barrel protein n=1 Tax=Pseudoalteromonas pernae TaxID=3118054 RepID=UPI0032427359